MSEYLKEQFKPELQAMPRRFQCIWSERTAMVSEDRATMSRHSDYGGREPEAARGH